MPCGIALFVEVAVGEFPEVLRIPVRSWANDFINWLVVDYSHIFDGITSVLVFALVRIEGFFVMLPWWLVILAVGLIAWHASSRVGVAIAMMALMFLIGTFGLWQIAMVTLAIMTVATVISVAIGVPIGIVMAKSQLVNASLRPVLDAMQTMPSFVYLIPVVMLFGLGAVPAILATFIYAVPPVIRLTNLGIRMVDEQVVEASDAFGATSAQILFGVQLPLARPTIMAGINQTVMMALAMVVIASMIGARGLGQEVLRGIQQLDVGRGLEAGLAIVALAIVIDRITQGYGRQAQVGSR